MDIEMTTNDKGDFELEDLGEPTMSLSAAASRHPLLEPDSIDDVLTYWPQAASETEFADLFPLRLLDDDEIVVDLAKAETGGMTPMIHEDSETPIYDAPRSRGRRKYQAAHFREKVQVGMEDVKALRRIGTHEGEVRATEILQDKFGDLEKNLMRRMMDMRKQVLFNGEVRAQMADGTPFKVGYNHPDYLEYTASTLWSNHSSAEPIQAVQNVIEQFEIDTARRVTEVRMPHDMISDLTQNDKFQEIAKRNFGDFKGGRGEIQNLFAQLLGGVSMTTSNAWMHQQTDLQASLAQGDTTVELYRADRLESGMDIFICDADNYKEKHTVDTVSGNTVTLQSGINRSSGFQRGAAVRYKEPMIPEDTLLILSEPDGPMARPGIDMQEVNEDFRENWAEMVSTRSAYPDLENPRPGLFTRQIDNTGEDPPHMEMILGISALPRVLQNEAWGLYQVK